MHIDRVENERCTRQSGCEVVPPHLQQRIIKLLGDYFKNSKVKKAYLFGSFARKEQTPKSDIDVMIEFDESKSPTLLDMVEVKLDLEELLQRPVDLVQKGSEYRHIKDTFNRDKILVHG